MRVKVGRKSQTYAKIQKARTTINNLKSKLNDVRARMIELDAMLKSCGTSLSKIERNLNTITKDNLIATPKITKKRRTVRTRMKKRLLNFDFRSEFGRRFLMTANSYYRSFARFLTPESEPETIKEKSGQKEVTGRSRFI